MLIVGELINASRKSVREIIEKRDAEGIAKLARDQRDNGANYIDVNAGVLFWKPYPECPTFTDSTYTGRAGEREV